MTRALRGSIRHVVESRAGSFPIAQALGDDFRNLHPAVRRHYSELTIDIKCTMDEVCVGNWIRPLALVSYRILRAPVPYSGRDVELRLHNRVDDSGAMQWTRTFFSGAGFPKTVTFESRMICSADHRIVELTRFGVGVESALSVDGEGGLVYDIQSYVLRTPLIGLLLRFPTWLSPFGRGRTKEIGETEDAFRIEFETAHPLFGRTLAYSGRCRFE